MKRVVLAILVLVVLLAGVSLATVPKFLGILPKLWDPAGSSSGTVIWKPELYTQGLVSRDSVQPRDSLAGSGTRASDGSVKFDAPAAPVVIAMNNHTLEVQGVASGQAVTLMPNGDLFVGKGAWGYYEAPDNNKECPPVDVWLDPVDQSAAGPPYPAWVYVGGYTDPNGHPVAVGFAFFSIDPEDESVGTWIMKEVCTDHGEERGAYSPFNDYRMR